MKSDRARSRLGVPLSPSTPFVDGRRQFPALEDLPPFIGYDSETERITKSVKFPSPICATWAIGEDDGEFGISREAAIFPLLRDILMEVADRKLTLVGHNLGYDLRCAVTAFPELIPYVWDALDFGYVMDTSHMHRLVEYAKRGSSPKFRSLADLSSLYLGETLQKEDTWRLRYGELKGVPLRKWPDAAKEYAIKDAVTTYRVANAIVESAKWKFIAPAIASSVDDYVGTGLTNRGFKTSRKRLDLIEADMQKKREKLLPALADVGIVRHKTTKHRDGSVTHATSISKKILNTRLLEILRAEVKLPTTLPRGKKVVTACKIPAIQGLLKGDYIPWEVTPAALEIKISEKLIAYLDDKYGVDHPKFGDTISILRTFDEYKTVQSFLGSTEGKGRIADLRADGGHVVRSSYDMLKITWRKGSSDPNLQNVPKKFGLRRCFIPRPGMLFAIADFAGLELYAIGQICLWEFGKSRLAEMLMAGVDVHSKVGEMFAGRALDTDELRATYRNLAKAYNFGYWGGLGYRRFNSLLTEQYHCAPLSKQEFTRYCKIYRAFFPEINLYQARFKDMAMVRHWGSGHYRLAVDGIDPDTGEQLSAYCKRQNTRFQCLGAVAAKEADRDVMRASELGLASAYGTADIHDEIVAEVPLYDGMWAGEHAALMGRMMETAARRVMPDVGPKVEVCLSTHWDKGAKPYWINKKELACWTIPEHKNAIERSPGQWELKYKE